MSRARATALALVNWRGVFYERYLLDPHVTALEGSNGAGKTTVMVAAYVVLLPDMTRLRFTNLGESGAIGGDRGIWGRLGEPGRPSYAVLELDLGGSERVLAGVHLERKAEPSVELTPFLVRGMSFDGHLQRLLLVSDGESDSVPQLAELRANVTSAGGQIEVFQTTREYFTALFDLGVTPLRLTADEDRNKYNDMLRTSMTGGISRALTTELRSFLLKEESGLSDTLGRVRGSLDACHRTRTEVRESRRLEHEITGVFEAGASMFAFAHAATRRRAEELASRAEEATDKHERALRTAVERAADASSGRARQAELQTLVAEARQAREQAVAERARRVRVFDLRERLRGLDAELEGAAARAEGARAAYEAKSRAREDRATDVDEGRAAYDRAAHGIADLQAGLDELHRRAHAHRSARERLERARAALGDPALAEESVSETRDRVRERLKELDRQRARVDREQETAMARRRERQRALDALAGLIGSVDPDNAHEQARAVLARLFELEGQAAKLSALIEEEARTRGLAERQAATRGRAAKFDIDARAELEERILQLEAELRAENEAAQRAERAMAEVRQSLEATRREMRGLEARSLAWDRLHEVAERIEAATGAGAVVAGQTGGPLRSRAWLDRARACLRDRRDRARVELVSVSERRDEAIRRAAALDASKGEYSPDLLRLRDEVDGELLASRFEELGPDEAARAQAELGPLAEGIIVRNPEEAGQRLLGCARELPVVYLVRPDAPLGPGASVLTLSDDGADALVQDPFGARLVRLPTQPTLGRLAREKHSTELRRGAEALDSAIEAARADLRAVEALSQEADRLLAEVAILEAGDPSEALSTLRAAAEESGLGLAEHDETRARARTRGAELEAELQVLRGLLPDAALLDPPAHDERAAELGVLRARAAAAGEELRSAAASRQVVSELLDALRLPAPAIAPDGIDPIALAEDRDRLFGAFEALDELAKNLPALGWSDAEQALETQTAVVPALEEQLRSARDALERAQAALTEAEAAWHEAARAWQEAEAARQAVAAQCRRVREEIAAEGAADVSESSLDTALGEVEARESKLAILGREELAIARQVAIDEERAREAEREAALAGAKRVTYQAEAEPAQAAWRDLQSLAESAGISPWASGELAPALSAMAASQDLYPEARGKGELLLDRLRAVRGGDEAAEPIRRLLSDRERPAGEAYLQAWQLARDWLARRLPAQVAEGNDPVLGLLRLRDQLATLEERLTRQESDLRGASEDVARGIEVQLRRTAAQIRRLNQGLEGVRFGSIAAIRVQVRRIERMQQILAALREGAVQELLFQSQLPIEEALNEIFRRYGGGKTGGQRILDYREYVELVVEVKRNVETDWEPASPTRLSTGEAIGVGAALMMVVLTEWERDATLLRARRPFGSLRFLFLDEANRLSQDNLGVLFDLCKNLDLQLLIAAPEVARAEGNTTYRLIRRVTEDGREEVIVSGRRTVTEPLPP